MSRARVVALFGGALLLLVLALGTLLPNRDPVWFRWFWSQPRPAALWLIIAVSTTVGLVAGVAAVLPLWLGQRQQRRHCQSRLRNADEEVATLRRLLARDATGDSTVGLPQP